jgi:hypothetical protein
MLLHARMKRAVLAMALVTVSSGVASAGGYIGLGVGTGPAIGEDTDAGSIEDDGRSARLIGGVRFGRFSIEGGLGGFDARFNADSVRLYQLSLSGKFNLPISDGFEAYGRAGIQRTSLNHDNPDIDADGTGLMLGLGMEYVLPLAVTKLSLWIDYQYANASMESSLPAYDVSTRMWTLGATIAF